MEVKKKMEQVLLKKKKPEIKFELIVLEELPMEQEQPKEVEVKSKKKRGKKALLKLIERGKYNPKYLEELVSIKNARRFNQYRNFGVR